MLAAVIFNALIIVALVPLALRGVRYRPQSAAQMLRRNLLIYGIGGLVAPFPCIWAIDRILGLLHLASPAESRGLTCSKNSNPDS